MIPGLAGQLLSTQFLEQRLEQADQSRGPANWPQQLRQWRTRQLALGPASSLRAIVEAGAGPLAQALRYEVAEVDFSGGTANASLRGGPQPVGLIVTGWGEPLDPLWRTAVVRAISLGAEWCLLFNGTHVRLVRSGRSYSRRFTEFDLDLAVDNEQTAAALWWLLNRQALSPDEGTSGTPVSQLVDLGDRFATNICRALRDGVLLSSEHVLNALLSRQGTGSVEAAFEQALTIVYRMVFLLYAEARSLVPLWHPIYRESYSLEALRDSVMRRPTPGLWDALRAVTRLAHAGCRSGDLQVTPFNGRLFAPSQTPLAERGGLDDEAIRTSLLALSTRVAADREGREPIAYRDLGVEQLGAVYETLLDYAPVVQRVPRRGRTPASTTVSLRPGSGVRKDTGSFYTPQSIAAYLVRQTIGPLVRDAAPDRILSLRILDPSMGSGAFLVAACQYLADAYETSLFRTGGCHPSDFGPHERTRVRRWIAERCLYGVDLNPVAVQLARLSLWLATLAVDRPLSFLDHHLQTGDSLLGAWLSCLRRSPTARRRTGGELPLFTGGGVHEALREALPIRFSLADGPNETLDHIRSKERALAALNERFTLLSRWKRIADLWCSRWFAGVDAPPASSFATLSDAVLTGQSALPAATVSRYLAVADQAATARRFFHWELEFPEVFFDASGARRPEAGFDAIVGNPPWDMVRSDSRHALNGETARADNLAIIRFTRDSGVYTSQSDGHANRYQLFLERALALARPGGRIGLVLPSGLATDRGSAPLRRRLFSTCDVDGLVGFENRRRIFPIHRSVRFLLLSATTGSQTEELGCRLGEVDPTVLERAGDEGPEANRDWFPLRVTPAMLRRLTGDDLAVPELRTPCDLVIAGRAATLFAPLGDPAGWGARFGRELNATEDRQHFTAGRGLPVIEGKLLHPFRVNRREAPSRIAPRDADRLLGERHHHARLAYRDVASATNQTTLIAAVLPAGCVSTHTVFCLHTRFTASRQHFLCGLFNSFVVNYLVRLRVTTHVTTHIVERLPIPTEAQAGPAFKEVAAGARLLQRRDHQAVGARLNAVVAQLYELQEEEFAHVLDTFPLVPSVTRELAMKMFRERF